MALNEQLKEQILTFQKNEITEYHIYRNLAKATQDADNRQVLLDIAEDEKRHYGLWKAETGQEVPPDKRKVRRYSLIGRTLGLTFAIKLMERGEEGAQINYGRLVDEIPVAGEILADEDRHEEQLLEQLDEERLRYTGSMVLGLSDALVELTGALAGLTLALQNTNLIGLTASITGIAAALSMAASEYLSTKSEETSKQPLKAAVYTGIAYLLTVLLLVSPYFIFANYFVCLAVTLAIAICIIAAFNYYVAVSNDEPFRRRFMEMAGLTLGVSTVSFLIGYVVRALFGVEV